MGIDNLDGMCPVCGEGKLRAKVGKNVVEYRGQSTELDFHFSICDTCGSEQANAQQTQVNKEGMLRFTRGCGATYTSPYSLPRAPQIPPPGLP